MMFETAHFVGQMVKGEAAELCRDEAEMLERRLQKIEADIYAIARPTNNEYDIANLHAEIANYREYLLRMGYAPAQVNAIANGDISIPDFTLEQILTHDPLGLLEKDVGTYRVSLNFGKDGEHPSQRIYPTLAEAYAYIDGLDDMDGWLGRGNALICKVISRQEAKEMVDEVLAMYPDGTEGIVDMDIDSYSTDVLFGVGVDCRQGVNNEQR